MIQALAMIKMKAEAKEFSKIYIALVKIWHMEISALAYISAEK